MFKELTPYEFVNYLISNDNIKGVYNNGDKNIFFIRYINVELDNTPSYYMHHNQTHLKEGVYTKDYFLKVVNVLLRENKILKLKKKCH